METLTLLWAKTGPLLHAIFGFIIILGPLVTIHELGHFFFARLFGVKAEIFSIGFGPRIFSRKWGETDFRLSIIPLGGYVKLLGENRETELSDEEAPRSLHRQEPWKRFFVFFGGPLFNFLFAIVIYMAVFVIGETVPANTVGRVLPGSPAEKSGFVSGDQILSVDGKPVHRFDEIMNYVAERPGHEVVMDTVHPGAAQPVKIGITPSSTKGYSQLGESTQIGDIDGFMLNPRATTVGISDPSSAAAKAGIQSGEQVAAFNGTPVESWEKLESVFASLPVGSDVKLEVAAKPEEGAAPEAIPQGPRRTVTFKKASHASMADQWGLHSSELFVEKTLPDSPAASMGLLPGDRLIGVGGKRVQSFYELKDEIQNAGETAGVVKLEWERAGKRMQASAKPTVTETKDPALNQTRTYTVGIQPQLVLVEPKTVTERILNPFKLVYAGSERMVTMTWRNFASVAKMITGRVSSKTLGGPILIAKIAGDSLGRGLTTFLSTMALLSIGLGVLNILPVPVLDGGHILLLAIESVRRRPLSMRTLEWVQGAGLVAILALMVYVFKNDISRF